MRNDLELRGHALSHAAATDFRRALAVQPTMVSVRLVDAGLQQFATREVVGFGIGATLAPPAPAAVAASAAASAQEHAP